MSERRLAERVGVSQAKLNYFSRGKGQKCRKGLRKKLSRALRVSEGWLSGELHDLPGARYPADYDPVYIKDLVEEVIGNLASLDGISPRAKRLPDQAWDAVAEARAQVTSLLAYLANPDYHPPRARGLPDYLKELQGYLEAVEGLLKKVPSGLRQLPTHLSDLRGWLERVPYEERPEEIPPLTDLTRHRFREMAIPAWDRDLREDKYHLALKYFNVKPGLADLELQRALEDLLTPEVWRAYLFTDRNPEDLSRYSAEDVDRTTVALARAMGEVLKPWFVGRASLCFEKLLLLRSCLLDNLPMSFGASPRSGDLEGAGSR
jgi:hypothetical protein